MGASGFIKIRSEATAAIQDSSMVPDLFLREGCAGVKRENLLKEATHHAYG